MGRLAPLPSIACPNVQLTQRAPLGLRLLESPVLFPGLRPGLFQFGPLGLQTFRTATPDAPCSGPHLPSKCCATRPAPTARCRPAPVATPSHNAAAAPDAPSASS